MAEEQSKVGDVFTIKDALGLKPVAEAINKATEALIAGASAILSPICLPAAEELGLIVKDRFSYWRARQLDALTRKLEQKMKQGAVSKGAHAHPRIVHTIIEQGSLADDAALQEMWAGLLVSSCTPTGDDDSNLIFTNLLTGLTRLQARILNYICEKSDKFFLGGELVQARRLDLPLDKLYEIAAEKDIHRLDRELDYLRAVSLIEGGFLPTETVTFATVGPTSLGLHLYIRCQGSRATPVEFFKVTPPSQPPQAPA